MATTTASQQTRSDVVGRLEAVVGRDHVVTDPAELRYYSQDLFFWDGAGTAAVVAAPADVEQACKVVKAAAGADMGLVVRGGGMSTGRSYVPEDDASVMIDMRRLDRIREINTADRYVVVEAGCTWETIAKTLAAQGWKCDIHMPLSGNISTVGGLLSHGVPGGLAGVLGVEVIRADGSVVRTGAWGRRQATKPHYREYGPDLTGIFLGDTGAFGVKTAAALHISRMPKGKAAASFGFKTYEDIAAAMVRLADMDALTTRFCMDPYDTLNVARAGVGEGMGVVASAILNSGSLLSGLKDSIRIVKSGVAASKDACWSLHLVAEGVDERAAEVAIQEATPICLEKGWKITSPISAATASQVPFFSIKRFVGRNGERWIATNAMFPISEAVEVVRRTEAFFAEREAELNRHAIRVGYISQMTKVHFQCEPLFYWADSLDEIHFRHLPDAEAKPLRKMTGSPETRDYVKQLRNDLRDFFEELGALHVHTSKFFRYAELFDEQGVRLLKDVKRALDPDRRLNRGNLGL